MSFEKRGNGLVKRLREIRVSSGVTPDVISEYLQALNCPRALTVAILFRNNEHDQLSELECDPLHFNSAADFRDAYAATKFLSKFKDLSLNHDLNDVALRKFDSFELLCRQTNSRFRNLGLDPLYRGPVVWLHSEVIRKIRDVLGEFSCEDFFEMANWGPGATTLIKSADASHTKKFQHEVGITRDLYDLIPLGLLEKCYPLWSGQLLGSGFPRFQVGNKVITVPKDAKANRVIAIEPGINLWFQMALGKMIGSKLRRFGVDLRFQERNQQLALSGSITGELATVDLSSASDSISKEVIFALLHGPFREGEENTTLHWFTLLDTCRSRFGLKGDKPVEWEKFSSMGNGFTFQLESLIFYALAKACVKYVRDILHRPGVGTVSVYGDDIIIPVDCLSLFSELCEFYGFKLNAKKTHSSSCFRESCGAHFYSGIDVKPYYLKSSLTNVQSVFRMANSIRRLANRILVYGCDARFRKVFNLLIRLVPKALRLRISDGYGDGGFIGNLDESVPQRARHCIEGYFAWQFAEIGVTYQFDGIGLLLARLRSPSLQESRNNVTLRGRIKVRLSRILIHQWYDLGPWF